MLKLMYFPIVHNIVH